MKKILFILTFLVISVIANAQQTYYWFGGAGNWSDVNHWSLSSGNSGAVLAPQVPTVLDNVVFDDNSGFGTTLASRTVNFTAVSYANDFSVLTTASGNAPLFSNSNSDTNFPYIKGNFLLSPNTVWNVRHVSWGTSDPCETVTIQTNGVSMQNIRFDDTGTKSLLSPLTANNDFLNTAGTVNTNSHSFYIGGQVILSTSAGTLNFSNSEVSAVRFVIPNSIINSTNIIIVRGGAGDIALQVRNNSTLNKVRLMAGGTVRTNGSTFAELQLDNHAAIESSNTITTLKLAPAKQFTFVGGQTTTVGTLDANTPDCVGLMELMSNNTTRANLRMVSGTVNIPNVRITGINATGGATFTATGVDNGNNLGWTFVLPAPKTIYWVGGADGNWNNQANWSATSGGAGGYCIPTQFDDVIFNAGSNVATPINIVGVQGYCKSITVNGVTGTPNFNSGTLNIYGSSVWQAGMRYNLTTWYRGNLLTNTLTNNGVSFLQDVYFDNNTGGWTLNDALTLNGTHLLFNRGSLNTNSQNVSAAQFVHFSGISPATDLAARQLTLGSSQISVTRWVYYQGSLDAGTSHISVSLNSNEASYASFTSYSGHHYHHVTFTAATSSSNRANTTFDTVTALNNHYFFGTGSVYRILNLTGGKNYYFQNGTTTTINEQLNYSTLDCSGFPFLTSTTAGSRATISMPASAGTVHIPNVRVRDIAVTGGATFTATGMDLGNNTGWVSITEDTTPKTLYWIGGSGEWTDVAHWTTNADGTPSVTGCVPTRFDNVIFNEFSGTGAFTVTNTSAVNSECHDMTWTDGIAANTRFQGNSAIISGSLRVAPGMIWFPSSVHFTSTDMGEAIETNGVAMNSPNGANGVFQFTGTGGWTFVDDIWSTSRILLYSGNMNTNGKTINALTFNFPSSGIPIATTATLDISNSIINVSLWSFNNTNITTTNSQINVNGRFHSANGVVYHNVTAGSNETTFFSNNTFNDVLLTGSAVMNGSNTFNKLVMSSKQLSLRMNNGTTQTVQTELGVNGTPCFNTIVEAVSGTANINVLAGPTTFDFVSVKSINASGLPLTFDRNSVDNGANTNITFNTGAGGLVGLGPDWICHEINPANPTSYTLSAAGFYGGVSTTYSWTKVDDSTHSGTLGTSSTLDISTLGYGTYRVSVDYGATPTCARVDEITVFERTPTPLVNANQKVCNNYATIAQLAATGSVIRWYDVPIGGVPLATTTALVTGTYYVTQTINSCESNRLPIQVEVISCGAKVNLSLKMRVSQ